MTDEFILETYARRLGKARLGDDGIYYGDPWSYNEGCTSELLRSGVDGPHSVLADQLCNLNERHHR